jgi:hypothetical protein
LILKKIADIFVYILTALNCKKSWLELEEEFNGKEVPSVIRNRLAWQEQIAFLAS